MKKSKEIIIEKSGIEVLLGNVLNNSIKQEDTSGICWTDKPADGYIYI